MTSETATKKNIQKLQRAIVEGLEDVKAQDIQVFNTENLSPLFERVIVASGTSNRQTKALAASVRDAVRDAGFDKPRVEGEENGEWIIVDCGQAVVHVMQPSIRQYYRLEDIWGETPVRLKSAEAKAKAARAAAEKARVASAEADAAASKPARRSGSRAEALKEGVERPKPAAKKTAARKAPAAKKAAPKPRTASASKTTKVQVVKVGAPAKKAAAKKTSRA